MNRKQMISISVVSIAIAVYAVAVVSASFSESSTPLYTYRMEQASNQMNFLPTKVNNFTYTTEGEYTLDYDAFGYRSGDVMPAGDISWGILTCVTCIPTDCGGCCTRSDVNC